VVPESHQGGEEVGLNRGGDELDLFPHGVGDTIRARG